jgi:hypothetical protein
MVHISVCAALCSAVQPPCCLRIDPCSALQQQCARFLNAAPPPPHAAACSASRSATVRSAWHPRQSGPERNPHSRKTQPGEAGSSRRSRTSSHWPGRFQSRAHGRPRPAIAPEKMSNRAPRCSKHFHDVGLAVVDRNGERRQSAIIAGRHEFRMLIEHGLDVGNWPARIASKNCFIASQFSRQEEDNSSAFCTSRARWLM